VTRDPFSWRQQTSHERMSGRPWDASYQPGPAPWDIGRPQPAVVRLASEGGFTGTVLDAGCGTGENALHVAALGLPVLGVDVAETALAMARAKAQERGIKADFATADAFQLERLERRFDTVLDCGLFHTFNGDEQRRYVASLTTVAQRDATLYVLSFSDEGSDTGPHPVSEQELRAAFAPSSGWNVVDIQRDRLQTRFHGENGAPAWCATVKDMRLGRPEGLQLAESPARMPAGRRISDWGDVTANISLCEFALVWPTLFFYFPVGPWAALREVVTGHAYGAACCSR
jgi:SAM-dependent methyltransferase